MDKSNDDVQYGIFTFQEDNVWIAAWKYFDIVAQGETEKEATECLIHQIGMHALLAAGDGELPKFGTVPKPPAKELNEWEELHNKEHEKKLNN